MREFLFRRRLRVAGAILGLTLAGAGACDLNPQPLPPGGFAENTAAGDDASVPTVGASSSSGSGFGSGSGAGELSGSSGAGTNSGSGSGETPGSGADAGANLQDAALEEGGAAVDAGGDAGIPSDSGSDGASPDASAGDASVNDSGDGCVCEEHDAAGD